MDQTNNAQSTSFSRVDIESRLRSVQAIVQGRFQDEKQAVVGAVAGAGILAVVVAYFAGKRKGRKQSAYVEIRRS